MKKKKVYSILVHSRAKEYINITIEFIKSVLIDNPTITMWEFLELLKITLTKL